MVSKIAELLLESNAFYDDIFTHKYNAIPHKKFDYREGNTCAGDLRHESTKSFRSFFGIIYIIAR